MWPHRQRLQALGMQQAFVFKRTAQVFRKIPALHTFLIGFWVPPRQRVLLHLWVWRWRCSFVSQTEITQNNDFISFALPLQCYKIGVNTTRVCRFQLFTAEHRTSNTIHFKTLLGIRYGIEIEIICSRVSFLTATHKKIIRKNTCFNFWPNLYILFYSTSHTSVVWIPKGVI